MRQPNRRSHSFQAARGSFDVDGVIVQHAAECLVKLLLGLDRQDRPAALGFGFGNHEIPPNP